MSVEFLSNHPFINIRSLPTSSIAQGIPTEAAVRYLKLPKRIGFKCVPRKLCFSMDQRSLHEGESRVGQKDGVIIVDHGSRRKESNVLLNEFVMMFKSKTGYPIVEPAHMELAEPTIRDAFGSCVHQGANRVIISPFFLFPGRHWHQDIPLLANAAALEHPGISYLVTAPLGLHELLVDVVKDRIDYCLSRVGGEVDECAVCSGTGRCQLKVQQPETSNISS